MPSSTDIEFSLMHLRLRIAFLLGTSALGAVAVVQWARLLT
jgi:hypothetical protein